jgi:hypothetical protein
MTTRLFAGSFLALLLTSCGGSGVRLYCLEQ